MNLTPVGGDRHGLRVLDVRAALGESPWWSTRENALYWVDSDAPSLSRFHLESGVCNTWTMPEGIGCAALCAFPAAILALHSGVALLDFEHGVVGPLHRPAGMAADLRFNDGKCDRYGRFWAGAHFGGEPKQPTGALFRFDEDLIGEVRETGIGISNGLGWSPDQRIFYYVDSWARRIYAYDFDLRTGTNAHRRDFVAIAPGEGKPDGLTVDSEGHVWCAIWDGWKVVRYTPAGAIDRIIDLPVQRPTSCMIGGADLKTLFITSARRGISSAELVRQPLAGCIFALALDIPGLPEPTFGCRADGHSALRLSPPST